MSYAEQVTEHAQPAEKRQRSSGGTAALAVLIGVLAGVLGLAPWLITGAKLPLQNLWGSQVLPDDMPVALLPLSQYEVMTVVALLATGGALAGLAVRVWSPIRRRLAMWCAAAGVLAVQVAATAQSFTVLNDGLSSGTLSSYYFFGLLAGVILCLAASLEVLLLFASRSRVKATLGVGLMAVPFTSWAVQWVAAFVESFNMPTGIQTIAPWIPAILVGSALAWCGIQSASRVIVWLVNLALLWLIPALFTSVQSVLGTRVIAGDVPEMLLMGRQVLAAALGPEGGALPRVALALALGIVGLGGRFEVARRRRDAH